MQLGEGIQGRINEGNKLGTRPLIPLNDALKSMDFILLVLKRLPYTINDE